jgi:hypothetical protein
MRTNRSTPTHAPWISEEGQPRPGVSDVMDTDVAEELGTAGMPPTVKNPEARQFAS